MGRRGVTQPSSPVARAMQSAGAMLRGSTLVAVLLGAVFLAPARTLAQTPEANASGRDAEAAPDEDDDFTVEAFIALRAYLVTPKARFRKGGVGQAGSSLRTQRMGLDDSDFALGGSAGVWLGDADRLEVGAWTFSSSGHSVTDRPHSFDGATIPAGTSLSIDYSLTALSLEYGHRFAPTTWCWLDAGLRVDFLQMRLSALRYGRLKLESVWPVPRVRIGLRPTPWLELEGSAAGFQLTTVSFGQAEATRPFEVTAAVRVLLPRGAYVEAGALTYHVHLEDDPDELTEDALHLHHRAIWLALGIRF